MREVECRQYDDVWWAARRGIPTASNFDRIITPAGKPSGAAEGYINELIADLCALDPAVLTDRGVTPAMRNGIDCEPEARSWYSVQRNVEVRQVGFCLADDGNAGASPDGLIDESPDGPGVLELKVPLPKTHVGYLRGKELPPEYKPQVHGQLVVTGRAWVDFQSYCPGFPPLIVRVRPGLYTDLLRRFLDDFHARYMKALEEVRTFA